MREMKYNADYRKLSTSLGCSPQQHVERYLALNAGLCFKDGLPPWAQKELPTQVPVGGPGDSGSSTSLVPFPAKKLKRENWCLRHDQDEILRGCVLANKENFTIGLVGHGNTRLARVLPSSSSPSEARARPSNKIPTKKTKRADAN